MTIQPADQYQSTMWFALQVTTLRQNIKRTRCAQQHARTYPYHIMDDEKNLCHFTNDTPEYVVIGPDWSHCHWSVQIEQLYL